MIDDMTTNDWRNEEEEEEEELEANQCKAIKKKQGNNFSLSFLI